VLTVTSANTYSGGTIVNANTAVVVGANSALGTGTVTLNGGGLRSAWNDSTSTPTISNAIVVNNASSIEGSAGTEFRVNGNISGNSTLDFSATYNASGLRLAGNNAGFTGTATVSKANVRLGATTAGSSAAAWVVNGNLQADVIGGGTFDLGSLSGYGVISGHANNASNAVSTLRVGGRNTDSTFNGRIVNNALNDPQTGNADGGKNNVLALTKVGSGVLTLGGNNTYTGATSIEAGTLRLANQPVSALAVANFTFDSVSGNTVTNAGNGGNSMNGTLNGGATIVGGGISGNALNLANGANVTINNAIADLSNNTSWTVSEWVKTATAGSTILSKNDGGWGLGNTAFYLGDGTGGGSGGTPSAVRWAGGFLQTTANSTPVIDNAWHLVTYVNNAGTYAIYTDGVLQSLSAGNAGFTNADVGSTVQIGSSTNPGDGAINFSGLLDNVQVYNLALSAQQVAGLVTPGLSPGPLPTTTNVAISNSATFDVNGVSQTVASLNAPAGASVLLGNGQLIINGSASSNYAGSVAGTGGSIVKQGGGTLTLSGVGAHTGPTVVAVGTLVLASTNAASQSPVTVSGGKLSLNVSGAGAVTVPSLSIAGPGIVDLGDDALILNYAAGDTAAVSNAVAEIKAGRITSSLLSGNNAMAIGYANSNEVGGTFRGVTLDGDAEVLLATFSGDADLNGKVDFNDFLALQNGFGTSGAWVNGDFNYDGAINFNDFLILQNNFGQGTAAAFSGEQVAAMTAWASSVPEPTGVAGIGLVVAAAAFRFGRRRALSSRA
jgi:autotransporter-associated beta strand protein